MLYKALGKKYQYSVIFENDKSLKFLTAPEFRSRVLPLRLTLREE